MARYQSKVTGKNFGNRKGTVQAQYNGDFAELANALSKYTPRLEQLGNDYITNKKSDAEIELQSLYASGKSDKEVKDIVMSGSNPKLSSMYTTSVVDAYEGKYQATQAIAAINENIGNYDLATGNFEDFASQYLPEGIDAQSKHFKMGFAGVYGQWKDEQIIKDAENKAAYAEEQKIMKAIAIQDALPIDQYWANLNSQTIELPEGSALLTTKQINDVAIAHVEQIISTAQTQEDVDRALAILQSNRGVGKGGNDLGSLTDTKDPRVATLLAAAYDKEIAIDNREYTLSERARTEEKRNFVDNYSAYMFGGTNSNGEIVEADPLMADIIKDQMIDTYPSLADSILSIQQNNILMNEDVIALEELKKNIMRGDYIGNPEQLMEDAALAGATSSTMSTLNALWDDTEARKANGQVIDVLSDSKFIKSQDFILKQINTLDPITAKYSDGTSQAILGNFISREYEDRYIDWLLDNKEPSKADGAAYREWNKERNAFLNGMEQRLLNEFKEEGYVDSIFRLSQASGLDSINFDNVITEDRTLRTDDFIESAKSADFGGFVSQIAGSDFTNELEALKSTGEFNSFYEAVYPNGDVPKDIVAEEVLQRLGVEVTDMNEELLSIENNIGAYQSSFEIPEYDDGGLLGKIIDNDNDEEIALALKESMTTIFGREFNINIFNSLSEEAKANLATTLNMSSEKLDQLVSKVF